MKRLSPWIVSSLVLAAIAVPAHAATKLVTPRLTSATGGGAFCNVVNAGAKAIAVTIEMLNFDGSAIGGPTDVTLEPDQSTSIVALGFHTFHCRFTGTFSKTGVRASATVTSDGHTVVSATAE